MKSNKKCLIVGKFAYEDNILDGQTVKCRTIYEELVNKYDPTKVTIVDTYKWKKKPLNILFKCIIGIKKHENIIIMPAQNGIKIFAPLFHYLNILFKKKIYYVVIGSWLYEKIVSSEKLEKSIKKFNKVFVETSLLKKQLESKGFNNVSILKNYKKLKIITKRELSDYKNKRIINACMFSRVNKEKGIMDAIKVISEINREQKRINLDIYGMVENQFKNEFEIELTNKKKFIKYKGIIDSSKSVEIIKKYDILLFPTKYPTEGIPGTIIDSYAAGVPVLASSWQNYKDIIDNKNTGIIFEFNNIEDFKEKLEYLYKNQKELYEMKEKCIEKAKLYCEITALEPLFDELGE